ncbi:MAG: hypothetical protein AAF311_17870 [Pseudomonadota bacterium]
MTPIQNGPERPGQARPSGTSDHQTVSLLWPSYQRCHAFTGTVAARSAGVVFDPVL